MTKWKLVPVEPDEDMMEAGDQALCRWADFDDYNTPSASEVGADIYEDMLAAAPPCEALETIRKPLQKLSEWHTPSTRDWENGEVRVLHDEFRAMKKQATEALAALDELMGDER